MALRTEDVSVLSTGMLRPMLFMLIILVVLVIPCFQLCCRK